MKSKVLLVDINQKGTTDKQRIQMVKHISAKVYIKVQIQCHIQCLSVKIVCICYVCKNPVIFLFQGEDSPSSR